MMLYPFFQYLHEDVIVLTPNRRLSAALHKLYQQYQLSEDKKTWETPRILPMLAWLNQLWNEATAKQDHAFSLLLNQTQEQFVWEKILLRNQDNEQLLQISETAELIKSAWGLLNQWQVGVEDSLFQASQDVQTLKNWITDFQETCRQQGWTDHVSLANWAIKAILKQQIKLPKKIILAGFTEYTPQLSQLLTACETAGSLVEKFSQQIKTVSLNRIQLKDVEDEIYTAARWAKKILTQQPSAAIGCVFPTLDKIRDRTAQIFSEVFAGNDSYTIDKQQTFFNISAGKSIARYPVISTALKLLNLHKTIISNETLSHVLMTPFLGDAENERIKRAYCDAQLKMNNKNIINLTDFQTAASLKQDCPLLAKRFNAFFMLIQQYQDHAEYSEWANRFTALLTVLGWPGERRLASEEYQAVTYWLELLGEFKTLDYVAGATHLQQALQTLQKMANNHFFQPKSPDASIQVLGTLEAAGMPFDYLWAAGMDDLSWPPAPKPHPLVPVRLQRELNMPHATASREYYFCEAITRQFKNSAAHLIFSHAEKNEELELQHSPLIKDIPLITKNNLELEEYLHPSYKIYQSKKLETFIDEKAPSVREGEKIYGGMSVIQSQALCPFKAFSQWRLHAREMESPLPGLKAKDRGTIIHKILELIWKTLQTQAALIEMDEIGLHALIEASIDRAIVFHSHHEFKNYIQLEKKCLHQMIWDWLQFEKLRSPFKVVIHENASQCKIGPLTLTIRIDRVDELENGKKLILDYKTGKNNDVNHWFGERPEEPQLPLYALLDIENICGISFAQVYPAEYGFKGVSHFALDIQGIKLISEVKKTMALSWNEQLQQWKLVLTQLSNEFYDGEAKVNPKEDQTCTWCALKPLCRINEEIS